MHRGTSWRKAARTAGPVWPQAGLVPPSVAFLLCLHSITYNGSMDSPVPLYPTDFPPSYETVMGLRGDSQVGAVGPWAGQAGQEGLQLS